MIAASPPSKKQTPNGINKRLPLDCVIQITKQFVLHTVFESAQSAANELLLLSTVNKEWYEAAHRNQLWKCLTLRVSPAAPFIPEFDQEKVIEKKNMKTSEEDPWKQFFCTSYTDPKKTSALANGLLKIKSWESLFRQRTIVGMHGEQNYRASGQPFKSTDCHMSYVTTKFFTCTTLNANRSNIFPKGKASFDMNNLTFIWEVYELGGCNTSRSKCIQESICENMCPHEAVKKYHDFGSYTKHVQIGHCDECQNLPQGLDYLTPKHEHEFASNPQFSPHHVKKKATSRRDAEDCIRVENLVMTATVSGKEHGPSFLLPGNPRFSIPFDLCMDHCDFSMWRVVVTARRDTDNKMCQIVDIRGTEGIDGFNEPGGDSQMGFAQYRVAEGTKDLPDFGKAFDDGVVKEVMCALIDAIEGSEQARLQCEARGCDWDPEEVECHYFWWDHEEDYGEGPWGNLNLSQPLDISVSFGRDHDWNSKPSSKEDTKNNSVDDEQDQLATLKQKLHSDHHYAHETSQYFSGFEFQWMDPRPRDYEDESRNYGVNKNWICAKLESLEWR